MERSQRDGDANQDGFERSLQTIPTLHEEQRQQNDFRRLVTSTSLLSTHHNIST